MSQSIPGKPVFAALPRLSSRESTVARGTALWESLVGKPRGKASWESLVGMQRGNASRESHRSLDPREGKRDSAARAREESARACPHRDKYLLLWGDSRRTPRSKSALERIPQVPAPTTHMILGPGIVGRGIPRGPRATRRGLAFPEATRAGP